jgi:hypothetical protein
LVRTSTRDIHPPYRAVLGAAHAAGSAAPAPALLRRSSSPALGLVVFSGGLTRGPVEAPQKRIEPPAALNLANVVSLPW